MRYCGIDLAGKEARLAVIEKTTDGSIELFGDTRKIQLSDHYDQESVKLFYNTMRAFLRDNNVSKVSLKKRNTAGEFAGGAVTFKMEGLIQAVPDVEVTLLHPSTISAQLRRHAFGQPKGLYKYQEDAFKCACAHMASELDV